MRFAREFARGHSADVRCYKKFGTAVLTFSDGCKLDIATARTEVYEYPAALPKVLPGSIRDDMFRRDFTINTLAASLNPEYFGKLLDFFNARVDIKRKLIRVMHDLSFVHDPTRVFRAGDSSPALKRLEELGVLGLIRRKGGRNKGVKRLSDKIDNMLSDQYSHVN